MVIKKKTENIYLPSTRGDHSLKHPSISISRKIFNFIELIFEPTPGKIRSF